MSACPRTWIGKLDTDHRGDPIVDGWPVDLTPYVGRRVSIIVQELPPDPESYEAIAQSFERRNCHPGKAPTEPGTHSVGRPGPAGAGTDGST